MKDCKARSLLLTDYNIWNIVRWVSSSDLHSLSSALAQEAKIAVERMNNCVRNERRCLTNAPYLLINLRGQGDPGSQVGLLPKKGQIFWDRDRGRLMRTAAPFPASQLQVQGWEGRGWEVLQPVSLAQANQDHQASEISQLIKEVLKGMGNCGFTAYNVIK